MTIGATAAPRAQAERLHRRPRGSFQQPVRLARTLAIQMTEGRWIAKVRWRYEVMPLNWPPVMFSTWPVM